MNAKELHETLAAIEHQRWADWQKYLHSKGHRGHNDGDTPTGALLLPADDVERWERQIVQPYAMLSEQEKESDREQVDRYWSLLIEAVAEWIEEQELDGFQWKLAEKWKEDMKLT
jgi:hypothetical protein